MRLGSRNPGNLRAAARRGTFRITSSDLTPVVQGWIPTDKANCIFWFAADKGVTQSGGRVTQWNDQSGNLQHATASGTPRPTYNPSNADFNAMPTIDFNGSNQYMEYGSAENFTAGTEFSIVFVCKSITGGFQTVVSCKSETANQNFVTVLSDDGTYGKWFWCKANGVAGIKPTGSPDFLTDAACGEINYTGGGVNSTASWEGFLDNVGPLTLTTGGPTGNNDSKNFIACFPNLTPPNFTFNGSIAEIFAYKGAGAQLSVADRTEVATYIGGKYGITMAMGLMLVWRFTQEQIAAVLRRIAGRNRRQYSYLPLK